MIGTMQVDMLHARLREPSPGGNERRFLQAFRGEHGAFLKRFAELKVRLDGLSD